MEEGDRVAVHFTHSGRHTGEIMGLAPTGRPFSYDHTHILRFEDRKMVEHWGIHDHLAFMQQLGALRRRRPVPRWTSRDRSSGTMTGRARWAAAVLVTFVMTACNGTEAPPEAEDASPSATATGSPGASRSGELVSIGERSLFLECRGSEGPTVILEAGLTGDHRTWEEVVAGLPPEVKVCAYDRANIGNSDPAPTPRSAQDVVDDLEALLSAAGEEPPYVLVGFSFGGIFTQLYAAEHPDEVAGLVLVESNHPDEARQFERHLTPRQIAEDRAIAQANPEGIDIYESFDQTGAAGRLPEVPLIVITAPGSGDWPPGWDPQLFDRLRAQQQSDLARLIPGGRQIVADGSGHDVPSERPDIVVEAIILVLG